MSTNNMVNTLDNITSFPLDRLSQRRITIREIKNCFFSDALNCLEYLTYRRKGNSSRITD